MIRRQSHASDMREAGTVRHFPEGAFAGICAEKAYSLIFNWRFIAKVQGRCFFRNCHTFEEHKLSSKRAQKTESTHGVLKVINQTVTKDEIELTELLQCRVFHVSDMKCHAGMTPARFLNICRPRVESGNLKAKVKQKIGKIANATASVQRGPKAVLLHAFRKDPCKMLLARLDKQRCVGAVKIKAYGQGQFTTSRVGAEGWERGERLRRSWESPECSVLR